MKIAHTGYEITGMVRNMSAKIDDNDGFVEIVLVDGSHQRGFDLNGFQTFIEDLRRVLTNG